MAKYRKRPVVIEAELTSELIRMLESDLAGIPDWFSKHFLNGDVKVAGDRLKIMTLEGIHEAMPDDYVICGVKGEIYPCKPDIFKLTYEPYDSF